MAKITKLKMKIDTEPLKQLERQLDNVSKFIDRKNEIFARICKAVTPLARSMMLESLKKSDITRRHGDLESMVGRCTVVPTKAGIRICAPPGLSPQEYAKMGALQYGRLSGVSGLGAKSRKKIKAAVNAGLGPSSAGATKARPYFLLDAGQVARLQSEFSAELQAEYDKFSKEK